MSRAVWVDAGNDVRSDLGAKYGITEAYFDARDPIVRDRFNRAVASGYRPGVYFANGWYPDLPAAQFAEYCDQRLKGIAWPGNAWVHLNIEMPSAPAKLVDFVVAALARWRQLRPTRTTALLLEGMKGGVFDGRQADIDAIVSANVRVQPELFTGDMSVQTPDVVLDLLMSGFPGDVLDAVYDGSRLPWRWRGTAFTQGRLP